jgi:tRNA(Ile)-lysidine synthase
MGNPPLTGQIERRVRRWLTSGLGPTWVIAVSGGSDSVGLLRLLHAIAPSVGLSLSVAHLDHGVRGESAQADAAFVAELAEALGLPFDVGQWQPTDSSHFESEARRARYAWLESVAHARGADAVAVGHTRDDQAETVLHRVIRGTGIRGLSGIPAQRALGAGVTLVRPLLTIWRQEIHDELTRLGQPFRDDATNADISRTRARIRHDLIPTLAVSYNPRVTEALVRLARHAAGSTRAYRERVLEIERFATWVGPPDHDTVSFVRDRLLQVPEFLRTEVLRQAWRRAAWPEAGMGEKRWRRLAHLVHQTRKGKFDVGAGVVAETGSRFGLNLFTLRRSAAPAAQPDATTLPESLPLDVPGAVPWNDGRVIVTLDPDDPRDETIDLDKVYQPLSVRSPMPGDRFRPLGMQDGEQILNDFFRGRRVPRGKRAQVPLVCDKLGIIWVAGHRIADRVRLTETTSRRAGLRRDLGPSGGPCCD